MHIFCLDYTVSVSKSYPLRVQNKLTTSNYKLLSPVRPEEGYFSLFSGGVEVDDALVRGAAEIEARVFQVVDEGAVDEDVTDI